MLKCTTWSAYNFTLIARCQLSTAGKVRDALGQQGRLKLPKWEPCLVLALIAL